MQEEFDKRDREIEEMKRLYQQRDEEAAEELRREKEERHKIKHALEREQERILQLEAEQRIKAKRELEEQLLREQIESEKHFQSQTCLRTETLDGRWWVGIPCTGVAILHPVIDLY